MLKIISRRPRLLALAAALALAASLPLSGMALAGPPATLTASLSGPTSVTPGSFVNYTMKVTDIDPTVTANTVHLAAGVPHLLGLVSAYSVDDPSAICAPISGIYEGEACTLPTLAAGASVNLTITIHVNAALTPPMPPFLARYVASASNAASTGLGSLAISVVNPAPAQPQPPAYTPPAPYNGNGFTPGGCGAKGCA